MQDFEDTRQYGQENRRDFDAPEIPRSKDEYSGFAGSQCCDLQGTISEPLILGEHNPTSLADPTKPDAVLFITREMVVVDFDHETSLDEFRSDWLYAQRPVDEEYRFIRRLRSGWLLRSHWCPD